MAGEALLILEPDTDAEQRLNAALVAAGFRVYAADDLDAVLRALESTRFPIVMLDVASLTLPIDQVTTRIATLQPDTMVVFAGESGTADELIAMMRGGAVDYVPKPFDNGLVVRRFQAAIKRRSQQRARLKLWEGRARAAEQALEQARTGSGAQSAALAQAGEFAEFALETFLAIERRNMEVERRLQEHEEPRGSRPETPIRAWVAHSDADFATGVVSLGPKLHIAFEPAMSTGGEVLDKLSTEPPQLVIIDASLPDIPGEFLVGSIRTEYPDIQMIVIEGWGTDDRRVIVTGGGGAEWSRPMEALGDLVSAMEEATQRARDASFGRDIATGFKSRHEEFLRRFAELKKALGVRGT